MNFLDENISNFVKIYDKAFTEDECKKLISIYDINKHLSVREDHNGTPNFSLLYIKDVNSEIDHLLRNRFYKIATRYKKEILSESIKLPPIDVNSLSPPKIKLYEKGGDDRFDMHVDVGSLVSSKRFIAFLLYLNDVDTGGETYFPCRESIKPKAGRCVVFPPFWMFAHQGNRTISHDKYIVSTYMQYKV